MTSFSRSDSASLYLRGQSLTEVARLTASGEASALGAPRMRARADLSPVAITMPAMHLCNMACTRIAHLFIYSFASPEASSLDRA